MMKDGNLELCIDKEFRSLCRRQDALEAGELLASLQVDGCLDPIRVWDKDKDLAQCPIVDGYSRHELCRKHDIPYSVVRMRFPERRAVVCWILRNQLGRRNCTPVEAQLLRAKLYAEIQAGEDEKDKGADLNLVPQPNGAKGDKTTTRPDQPTPPRRPKGSSVAKQVAEMAGVTEQRVVADVRFSRAVDKLGEKSPILKEAVIAGEISKVDAVLLATAGKKVLQGIEAASDQTRKAVAHATAEAIKHKKVATVSGRPIVVIDELKQMEDLLGKVTRLKTVAMEKCGGRQSWAAKFDDQLRLLLVPVFNLLLEWQTEAAEKKEQAA